MRRTFQILLAAAGMFFAAPLFAQLTVPEITYDSAPNLLKLPDNIYMGRERIAAIMAPEPADGTVELYR